MFSPDSLSELEYMEYQSALSPIEPSGYRVNDYGQTYITCTLPEASDPIDRKQASFWYSTN